MTIQRPFQRIAIAGLGAALLSASASALADPPSRIARLAYVSGPVSFAPAGDNQWVQAPLNRPLIAGDRLWVEADARDEVQLGGAALRMGGNTLVTLLNVDDRTTQLQLSQGRLNVRVRQLGPGDVFEIDTPNLALTIRQPGDYRIEVDPLGNATMVAVRSGQAEAYGDGNAYRIGGGQAYSFGGTDLRAAPSALPAAYDTFDRWADTREQRRERAQSARYVSPNLVGFEDLDEQGTWRTVPDYGNVWMPQHVSRDWAPYRDGHWSYVQPWGWTWVDDAPWGFAVSHYGRWARFPAGWGWVPGPRAASPVYAPALVAFVSVGAGAYAQRERPVAWFPLAPREAYRPSYRASPTYITNINITNTTFVRNEVPRDDRRADYANRHVGGAVTAMPASAFVHAQPVSRAAMAIPAAALAAAAIAHTAPVAPERDSMRGHGNPGHQPPPALMARQVLARTAPPPSLRQAPIPVAHGPQPAAPIAGPALRMLPQDRHGGQRQLRDVPTLAATPAAPQPNGGRFDRHADARPNAGQAPVPAVLPSPAQEHGADRMQRDEQAHQQQQRERQQQDQQRQTHASQLQQLQARQQQTQQQERQQQDQQRQAHQSQQQLLQARQQQTQQQEHQQQDQQRLAHESQLQQLQARQQQTQQQEQQKLQQQHQDQQRQKQEHDSQQLQARQQQTQQQEQQKSQQLHQDQQRQRQEHESQQQQKQLQERQQQAQQQQQQKQHQEHEQQRQQQQQQKQEREQQQQKQEQERQQQQQKQQQERGQQLQKQQEQQKLQQQQRQQQEQQQRERQQHERQQHAPAPQPPAAAPVPAKPAPQPAKAVPPAPQAAGEGKGHEGKKDDHRHGDHPEQH